jgi:hypothetical protein
LSEDDHRVGALHGDVAGGGGNRHGAERSEKSESLECFFHLFLGLSWNKRVTGKGQECYEGVTICLEDNKKGAGRILRLAKCC